MENNHFDRNIRKKLKDLEVEFNPNDWKAFEERLDIEDHPATEPEIEDIYFDGVVYDKLSKYEEAYNPTHWTLMSNQLDDAFLLRKKIYKYKVLEMALMFLAIFTFIQFFPTSTPTANQHNIPVVEQKTPVKSEDQLSTTQLFSTQSDQLVVTELNTPQHKKISASKNKIEPESTTQYKSNDKNLAIDLNIEETKTTQRELVGSTIQQNLDKQASIFSVFDPIRPISILSVEPTEKITTNLANSKSIPSFNNNSFLPLEVPEAQQPVVANASMGKALQNELLKMPSTIAPIHTAAIMPLAYASEAMTQEKDLPYNLPELKKTGLRFSMFSTLDYNYVLTPHDVLLKQNAQTRTEIGYGAGFTLGFRFKRFELETGGAYSIKKYASGFSETVDATVLIDDVGQTESAYLKDELKDIELNMLSIPLNLRYTFKKYKKWHASIVTGASLNMALQASYDRLQSLDKVTAARSIKSFKVNKPLLLDAKKYPDGLLEGGNFMENSYFTANLGLGIERIISPRWSLFFQPTYQHFIQISEERLGPNKDRINTFSISAGAKVNLK